MRDDANPPFSACVRCATCDGFPCLVHAKSDAEVLGVRPALEYPNVTLVTGARAVRLETDAAGKTVTGVVAERDGGTETFRGDLVVVSCGAANSAACCSPRPPTATQTAWPTASGQVGRNYMFHNSQAVLALSKDENPTVFQKTLGLNDFYFRGRDVDYPLGNIQMVGKSTAPMYRGEKPLETKLAPTWSLDQVARHAVDFWLSTEDLPRPDNRVTLRPRREHRALATRPATSVPAKKLLRAAAVAPRPPRPRARPPDPAPRVPEERHPGRGLRAPGRHVPVRRPTPATSVLDVDCRAHEVDNLYVVDTSFFPSIGAVNPALTAMANALRVGDRIAERLGATVRKAAVA